MTTPPGMKSFTVGKNLTIGPKSPLTIIAGPCVAESLELCMQIGEAANEKCAQLGFSYIFKASFDKANRSSIGSYRGPGLQEGLAMIEKTGKKLGVPTTTDIHETQQCAPAGQAIDLLQIPAFLCRQTDLLLAAAMTGRPVNAKKGQFLSPAEMGNVVSKLQEGMGEYTKTHVQPGGQRPPGHTGGIMLTERGTFFGYHRLVNDFVGVGDMMELGWPVCFDVTHSTQKPGEGKTSGGRPERAPMLAKAAVAIGVQALFIETHPDPANAKSDAATVLHIERMLALLSELAVIRNAIERPLPL